MAMRRQDQDGGNGSSDAAAAGGGGGRRLHPPPAADAEEEEATAKRSDASSGSPSMSPAKRPLKTVLQAFLEHVDALEERKSDGDDTYEREFQRLKAFSDSLRSNADFSSSYGEMEVNRKKNRYKDILPFDVTRVTLSEYPGSRVFSWQLLHHLTSIYVYVVSNICLF